MFVDPITTDIWLDQYLIQPVVSTRKARSQDQFIITIPTAAELFAQFYADANMFTCHVLNPPGVAGNSLKFGVANVLTSTITGTPWPVEIISPLATIMQNSSQDFGPFVITSSEIIMQFKMLNTDADIEVYFKFWD